MLPESFPIPSLPLEWTVQKLREHIQTAMQVELATIPLYLSALYSINDTSANADLAKEYIKAVVIEEMLHLSLAGNMLRALDGSQHLYDKAFIPEYPSRMFKTVDLELRPTTAENLQSFVDVEKPYAPVPLRVMAANGEILPTYHSIGEFYQYLQFGIEALCAGSDGTEFFKHNHDEQFNNDEVNFDSPKKIVVKDQTSARDVLKIIITQGEGGEGKTESHYQKFTEVLNKFKQQPWNYQRYLDEPKTAKYPSGSLIQRLSLSFNALYCYLLQTIDQVWVTPRTAGTKEARANLIDQMMTIMSVMKDLAKLLVTQGLSDDKSPAPCFEFYPSGGSPLSAPELLKSLRKEITDAMNLPGNPDAVKSALEAILSNLPKQ